MTDVSSYVRPTIEEPVFRDSDGRVIEYGNLWADSPPESAYSVTEHPERYAPLHAVADALIEHIRETYDVEIDEGPEAIAELVRPHRDTTRAVRIRPSDSDCATLTLIFTSYPGIGMHAGLLHDFSFPSCGCDACDSTWQTEADRFERQVFAVVTGNYRERVGHGQQPSSEYAFTYPNGRNSGGSPSAGVPAARLDAADPILRALPDGWAAWPPRP
ncbi:MULTISPECIES: DUF6226 family protein [unclassified Rhodococcus (in: high G+C Gram-positive bacteria)]|uniref:DUF6226 family protein n=1 Tax=unclassified Rhodococcus (in: high G+C Gram-positive bacteria) TaxID=192944 RepID=UPI001C9B0FAB|nr:MULTISPECIES: DUF6226 family protein [unclassified Rhodococcus (in: high G+C Gram-positive bacteria)]